MKALIVQKPGVVATVERDIPDIQPGEVLLKLSYVGFCGSDLSTYLGKNPMVKYPRVPGHEISGIIAETGDGVPDLLSPGDPATVVPYTNCETCPSCLRGRSHACQFNETLGIQRDGAMQEFISVPWRKMLKAPKLSLLELAMVEPLTVGFHAVERGRVSASDVVMVLGCGMIGSGAIAGGAQKGATVIAVDIDDHKLDLARIMGAHHTINSKNDNLHEEVSRITSRTGPDVVVEAVGNPDTYRTALEEVAFTGRVICIGYSAGDISLATNQFVKKELDIMGSRNATPEDFSKVISYLELGTFPLDQMISLKVKPENAQIAFQSWADDPGKIMKILLDLT